MHAYLFKDRSARAITIEFDGHNGRAVAWHRDQPVGWIRFEPDASALAGARATLVDLFVEPAFRRSGIAHTLLARLYEEVNGPIEVDASSGAQGAEFSSLCRNLVCEGLIVSPSR
jgi:GNAT superfamily N-acetyltransferase